jgi:hypothetical protein
MSPFDGGPIAGSGGRRRGLNDEPAIDERFRLNV